jgi:hypothetical protein
MWVDWPHRRVSLVSDFNGVAAIQLEMGGVCNAAWIGVYACNVFLGQVTLASPDQDGDLDVDAADAARVRSLIGKFDRGADFNCDMIVTQADFDWLANFHGGHTCPGGVPTRPTTWGSIKLLYR